MPRKKKAVEEKAEIKEVQEQPAKPEKNRKNNVLAEFEKSAIFSCKVANNVLTYCNIDSDNKKTAGTIKLDNEQSVKVTLH